MSDPPDQAVVVARAPSRRRLREYSLVLEAVAIEHFVIQDGRGMALVVAPELEGRALDELAGYQRENRGPRTVAAPSPPLSIGAAFMAAAPFIVTMVVIHLLARAGVGSRSWMFAGENDVERFRAGEWWRAVTALTLHADIPHLASNLVFGVAFLILAAQVLGAGPALLGAILAGVIGNALETVFRPDGFSAIGASTAVFGAVGVLGGALWHRRRALGHVRMRRWAPVVVALIVLAWYGMSGERTDVLAHVTGLAAGLPLGALLDRVCSPRRSSVWLQAVTLAAPLALVALAWRLAFEA